MASRILNATTRLASRQRSQRIIGSCIGLTLGTGAAMRSSPSVRFDLSTASSSHTASPSHSPFSTTSAAFSNGSRKDATEKTREDAKAELMKQLSSGSVTGFVSGILLSVFSRTLVLLLGVGVVVVQVAARYGINIVDQLRLKQRLGNSKITAALQRDPVFKLSFGLFFALSAFMQF